MRGTCRIDVDGGDAPRVVRLAGELDIADAEEARATLCKAAHVTVVADLSRLTFIDSSGIAAIVAARAEIELAGNRLEVHGASGIVRRVFELVGLGEILTD